MSIVITGNPGVGKHTISRSVAEILNNKIIDINETIFKSKLYKRNTKTVDIDVFIIKKFLEKIIDKRSIIVGHLAPYVLTNVKIKTVIVLRKNPYDLITIYKNRNYDNKKMSENLCCEILGITAYDSINKFGINKTHQIDTTSKSITKITENIVNIYNGTLKEDRIDWLSLIFKRNDLKFFFK